MEGGEADAPPLIKFVVDFGRVGDYYFELEIDQPNGGAPLSFNAKKRDF